MKKLLSIIMVAALVFGLNVSVFAAPSPSTDPNVEKITDTNGNDVDGTEFTTSTATETAPAVQGYTVMKTFDVTVPVDADPNGYYVYYNVAGVKKGDTVKVWQYVNGEWVQVEGVATDDNTVRVLVKEDGTIAVYRVAGVSGGTTTGGTTTTGSSTTVNGGATVAGTSNVAGTSSTTYKVTSTTSPKTGDNNMAMVLVAAAGMFAVAAVVAGKKARA